MFADTIGTTPERRAAGGPRHALLLAEEVLSDLSLADFEESDRKKQAADAIRALPLEEDC
jgi:hypothetical protein